MSERCEYFILNLIYSYTYAVFLVSRTLSCSLARNSSARCGVFAMACFINYICTYPHNAFFVRGRCTLCFFSSALLFPPQFDPMSVAVQYINKCKCEREMKHVLRIPFLKFKVKSLVEKKRCKSSEPSRRERHTNTEFETE